MNHIAVLIPDVRLALRLIVRSRIVLIVVIVGLILCGVAWLAGQFSPRQPATVALDVGLSFVRLALPILALLQIHMRGMSENAKLFGSLARHMRRSICPTTLSPRQDA